MSDNLLRRVEADFSGGTLSSDGGALLLGQVDAGLGISRLLAGCYTDRRDPDLIEHSVQELVSQRLIGLALGYEDLNDHADLRRDPLLAAVIKVSVRRIHAALCSAFPLQGVFQEAQELLRMGLAPT